MSKSVEIIAHRGESAEAPENTLAAFHLAWRRRADAIECDVHQTRDGHLMVCHDANTQRTTGVSRTIADTPLAELQTLDAGIWKGAPWAGERLPLLSEVLALLPDGNRCFIEMKAGAEAIPALVQAVQQSGKREGQFAIISFHAEVVAAAKRHLPQIPAYLLASLRCAPASRTWTPAVMELLAQATALGAEGLDLSFQGEPDSDFEHAVQAAVQQIHNNGLECYAWTVDQLDAAQKLAAFGVDGITTNRAAWLKSQLNTRL